MSFQPGAVVNTQGFGSRAENVEVPHVDTRAPQTTDVLFPIGKRWVNTSDNGNYILVSQSSANGVLQSAWAPQIAGFGVTGNMIAGFVIASNLSLRPTSFIMISRNTLGGTAGNVEITSQSLDSFSLQSSSSTETSNFNYIIIN